MENNLEGIDNLFKEELGGYTEVPPPPVWQALEKRLDNDRKRRVFPFRWFWYISLISFVLLGALVAFKIANDNHSAVAVNATEDGTKVSKTQEATPAPNTSANETPIANYEHPRKKPHHRHTKKQANHNNLIAAKEDRKSNTTISKTAIASVEQKIPAKSRQQENYNSSTSGLYAYEEEDTEPVKNTQVVSVPLANETHDGYVVNKIRKHNLVAADMTPVVNEEKTVTNRKATRANSDEQNEDFINDNADTKVVQQKTEEAIPVASTLKAKKTAAVIKTPTGVTQRDHKITPAATPVVSEDAYAVAVKKHAVKKNNDRQIQVASSGETPVNRIPTAATTRNSKAGTTVNIKTAPKHKVIASKKTPVKTTTEPVVTSHPERGKSTGNEFDRQKKNRQKTGTGSPKAITPASMETSDIALSAPAKVPEHQVSAPVTKQAKQAKQASTIPQVPAKTTVAAKSPGKKLIDSVALSAKTNKVSRLSAAASVPAQPVTKKSGNKIPSPVQNVEQEKSNETSIATATLPKDGTGKTNKKTAVVTRDHVKNTAIPTSEKGAPHSKQQIAKKVVAKKVTGSPQTVSTQKKYAASTYAAVAQPQFKNTTSTAKPNNNPVSSRPSLNSNTESIEEPSIIKAIPQAASHDENSPNITVTQPASVTATPSSAASDSQSSSALSKFSYGIKSGFEAGFKQGAAGKFLIAPYLEYKLSSKISLMTQPAIKVSYLGSHTIDNASIYYDTSHSNYNYALTDSHTIFVPGVGLLMSREYKYSETHDSIAKSYSVGGTYVEFELPLLLKYNITPKLSVYGGLNMGYSRLMRIKETSTTTSVDYTKPVTTVTGLTQPPPDPAMQLGSVVFAGSAIGNYSGPLYPSQSGGMFRLGYMLGFSYEIKKRWMIDALIQQAKANSYIQGGYNVNTALSLPYFRFTLGYRLSK